MQRVSSRRSPILFRKKLRPLLLDSKSSVNTISICLLENGRIVPDASASLNEFFTSPTINESVLTLPVDEFSNHASELSILRRRHPIFIFMQLVWPKFLKSLRCLALGSQLVPMEYHSSCPKLPL